jgi:hypothetical protein
VLGITLDSRDVLSDVASLTNCISLATKVSHVYLFPLSSSSALTALPDDAFTESSSH